VQENNTTRVRPASVSAALAAARAEASATPAAGSLASANFPHGRLSSGNLASGNLASGDGAGGVRFPAEDGGRSLAEMAQRDLDAALQLLADRAQYITGASGAAIALRRDGKNDMLCRASAGSNAPELGALLSTEFGLSGESVRTRQALRCDDAERDARVNREVCRQLGIASVVVMPVVNDDEVLGVFELFSGKANAFGARDVSAIQRLSEMVETAVRLAQAAESLPKRLKIHETSGPVLEEVGVEEVRAAEVYVELPEDQVLEGQVVGDLVLQGLVSPNLVSPNLVQPNLVQPNPVLQDALAEDEEPVLEVAGEEHPERLSASKAEARTLTEEKSSIAASDALDAKVPALAQKVQDYSIAVVENAAALPEVTPDPRLAPAAEITTPKKPLFWSAALTPAADAGAVELDQSHVPPVLRSLHKCEACGFPVSAGRVLCVECEEKKWRGQLRLATPRRGATPGAAASAATAKPRAFAAAGQSGAASAPAPAKQSASIAVATLGRDATALTAVKGERGKEGAGNPVVAASASSTPAAEARLAPAASGLENQSPVAAPDFVLSAGLEPSQSWLAANKYIVGVILLVAAAAGAAFFLLH
jgi:GAF domain-containing protein